MTIVKWEPFSMRPRFRFPRWMQEDFEVPWDEMGKNLNVYETDSDVVVEANVPGVPIERVEVSIDGDTITIRGEVEETEEDEKKKHYYKRMEKRAFYYSTTAPRAIQADKALAEIEDGVVKVTIPKTKEAKPKMIKVKEKKK